MLFRQLFDNTSSTYTYLLADETTRRAILIDPVFEQAQRDMALLRELNLTLALVVDTHAHADHVTAAWLLQEKTGCQIASAKVIGAEHVNLALEDAQVFGVDGIQLKALSTPGHTNGCMSYVLEDQAMVFTGDTLLIRGCGRSDFQEGSAHNLFHSITEKLFSLPDHYRVYPAHDYNGRTQSTIGEEKAFNARVGGGADEHDFVEYMHAMKLPHPKKIDEAVPANHRSGCPENGSLPEEPDWGDIKVTYAGVPEVDIDWLQSHRSEVTLLDVRDIDEVRSDKSPVLQSDLLIPLDKLRQQVADVPSERPVVALCRSGRRSAMAVSILTEAGIQQVASLRGGIIASL